MKNSKFKNWFTNIFSRAWNWTRDVIRNFPDIWFNRFKVWQRAAVIVGGVLIVAGIIALIVFGGRNQNQTVMEIALDGTPQPVQFRDIQAISMLGGDDDAGARTQIALPAPNNDRELTSVQPVEITYNLQSGPYAPMFRSDITSADLERGARISPFVKGKWTLNDTDGATFAPAHDWPAAQTFTITFDKKLFGDDVRMARRNVSFATPEFAGNVESFGVYPNVAKGKTVIAVAVVSYNYPLDTKTFADAASMRLDGDGVKFSVKYDTFNRVAFITSDAIPVRADPQKLKLIIGRATTIQGNARAQTLSANATIEAEDNFFKISDISTTVADNQRQEPEQLLLLNFTSAANDVKWDDYVVAYLLPQHKDSDEDADSSHQWKSDEIGDEVIAQSEKLPLKRIDFANARGVYQYAFSYDVNEKNARYMYVSLKPGLISDIGFPLKNGGDKILAVPYPEQQVKIAGSGALLSVAGGRKLAIMSRGGAPAAYVNLYKVKAEEINHLVSQTYNIWDSMDFRGYSFGPDDISVVFRKKITFADKSFKKTNYSAVDLGEYLNKTNDRTGIFIVQVGPSQNDANNGDRRLILLTDLGLIRKINADNSSAIFVSSLAAGTPVADARVAVLGKNGEPIWSGDTDAGGRANIPNFPASEYNHEKEPVAITVTRGGDTSFIPYSGGGNQRVEYSKYDIDGEYNYASGTSPIGAYMFSDRGIYRPGEQFIIGGIAKDKSYKSLAGVPVKLEVRDSRDRVLTEKTFSLSSDGMFDYDYKLSASAPIGNYQANLYSLSDKGKNKDTLGNISFRVEEFVPDTLKINVAIKNAKAKGWIKPTDLSAHVSLFNLFGTPATDRRISARATLSPAQYSFPEFADYQFTSNIVSGTGLSRKSTAAAQTVYQDLPDARTDGNGNADMDIKFDGNVNSGTYVLSFSAEGYEGDSGKSVQAGAAAKVSDAEYLVGYKASDALSYIKKGAKRTLSVIAINSDVAKTYVSGLTMRVVKKQSLVALVKDYSGYYKYQTTMREKIIKTQNITIAKSGMGLDLDTAMPGDYYIEVADAAGKILLHADYFVAGAANVTLSADQQAELKMKLSANEYAPGSDIELNITAPYVGSGLITIEKDKVYAYKWFRADATSTVQHITLPNDFEGDGYVNVSFVRDINSRDVFTVPYAYAVAPFAVDKAKRTIKIDLKAADIVRDKKLTVKYTVNRTSRIMLFAVNEGILQVAKYQNPSPLAYFFRKSALQVTTYQILSLLLPEYDALREFAKTGGGEYADAMEMAAKNITNPFARAHAAPVAFYSGILNAAAGQTNSATFDIPDQFNGEMRIYAVAANDSATGSAATSAKIQSPIVISETAPFMAVPGDEFTVNAVVSNMAEHSGPNAKMELSVGVTDNLEVIGDKTFAIAVPEGQEKLWKFTVRAKDGLGNAEIAINAKVAGDKGEALAATSSKSTLSVRPATAFLTNITGGYDASGKVAAKNFQIDMYPELSSKTLLVSDTAFVLAKPLFAYLKKYEYGCSEQTVSKALPYVLFQQNDFLGTDAKTSNAKVADAINILRNRQNDDGSFALWDINPAASSGDDYDGDYGAGADAAYVTAYVAQFLTLAKESGFGVPNAMLSRAVDYLRTYAGGEIGGDSDAAARAFAIYLISRNGFVTTNYLDAFQEYADANMKGWQKTITGAYIAASYKILKQDSKADSIISQYKTSESRDFSFFGDYSNNVSNDSNYLYLMNKYFAGASAGDAKKALDAVQAYVAGGYYSSFTSAAAMLALAGFKNDAGTIAAGISAVAQSGKNTVNLHPADPGAEIFSADIPADATRLDIACANCGGNRGFFWAIMQQGFPRQSASARKGLEVIRAYYNAAGEKITRAAVGETVTVKISVRATDGSDSVGNVVVTDLLPAGFAAEADSVSGRTDFSEVKEDRVLAYLTVSRSVTEITYRARLTAVGSFTVPAISAASMYNPQISGTGEVGKFTVENAKTE
ncbi:MAG: MG2 domain-containing protein [Proteobacteria bacterium]|nr:MG2 domain-containing protein [Pseudomonadota bacterium]